VDGGRFTSGFESKIGFSTLEKKSIFLITLLCKSLGSFFKSFVPAGVNLTLNIQGFFDVFKRNPSGFFGIMQGLFQILNKSWIKRQSIFYKIYKFSCWIMKSKLFAFGSFFKFAIYVL